MMKDWPVFKYIRPYLWIGLPLLGGVAFGGLILARTTALFTVGSFRQAVPLASLSPGFSDAIAGVAPAQVSSPLEEIPLLGLSGRLPTSPTPSPTTPASPQIQPSLTPEQEAMNQAAMEEFMSSVALVDSLIEMKVAIAEGVPSAIVSSSTEVKLMDREGNPLHTVAANTPYSVAPRGNGLQFGSWQVPGIVWLDIPPDGLFSIGDRTYRGRLLLVADAGNLWGVNYVSMRSYLYSVVPSEVSPSWDMDALKAQAIAARSYALTYYFKPASSLYHIGSTQRYQVYSGIAKEDDRTRQAVDETSGEFISHEGGIVQSLYAASDAIVSEVFRGQGMSQLGALNLAEQGYTYEQILSNYYPGTAVGRIEQEY